LKGKLCVKFNRSKCNNRCPSVKCAKGFISKLYKHTCCPRCIPCKCSRYFDPVCSTNGITFRNSCEAKCLQFTIKHKGACNKPCDGRCPAFIKPVCGKDKKTYRNRCVLRSNLVKFAHNGKCGHKKKKLAVDPKDAQKKKFIKKIQKDNPILKKFEEKNNALLCDKTQHSLKLSIVKYSKKFLLYSASKNQKLIAKYSKLSSISSKQLVKVMYQCLNYKKISQTQKKLAIGMEFKNKKFNDKWLFHYRHLTAREKLIKSRRLEQFEKRLAKCHHRSIKIKNRWNQFFQIKRRNMINRINNAKSLRVKRYLKKTIQKIYKIL